MRPARSQVRTAATLRGAALAAWAMATCGLATGSTVPEPASGQPERPPAAVSEPGPVQTAWRFSMVGGYNDNLSLLPAGALGSAFVALLPGWSATRESATWRVQLNLKAELLRHASHSEFNTDNSELSIDGLHALADQRAAAWRVTLQDWHDPVGTSSLARPDGEPDHFVAAAAGAVLRQDIDGGTQRLEGEISASRKQYQNHRAATVIGDVATQGAVARWQYRAAPDLRWLTEARWVLAHYPFQIAAQDHEDLRVLGGFELQSTPGADPAYQLQVRMGLQRLRFDRLRPDLRASVWDLQGRWPLGAGHVFELGAGRQTGISPGDGADSVSTRQWRTAWVWEPEPAWRAHLGWSGSLLRYTYGGFADGLPRTDRSFTAEFGLRHTTASGLTLSLSHARSQRQSTEAEFDFRRRLSTLAIEWPL